VAQSNSVDPIKEAADIIGILRKLAFVPVPAGDPNAAAAQQAGAAPPGAEAGMPPEMAAAAQQAPPDAAAGGVPPELMAAMAQQQPQAAAAPPAEQAPPPAPAMTPDDIRNIIREELNGGQQGGGQQSQGGGKGAKSNHNELIKNISTDQFHTKRMLEVLFEHLGVPLPSFSDPNRHPETGLPVEQSPAPKAKAASIEKPSAADEDAYETTGGSAVDYPPDILRNATNSTTLRVLAALKGSSK